MNARFVCIHRQALGRRYLVPADGTFGRSSECDVFIPDAGVSRVHATLLRRDERWLIEDAGSRNGVWVNGSRTEGPHALAPNDCIAIGPALLLFEPDFDLLAADEPGGLAVIAHDRQTLTSHQPQPMQVDAPSLAARLCERLGEVSAASDLESFWTPLLQVLGAHSDVHQVGVLARGETGAPFEVVAVHPSDARLAIPASVLAAIERGEGTYIGGGVVEPVQVAAADRARPRAALALPLTRQEQVVGALYVTGDAGLAPWPDAATLGAVMSSALAISQRLGRAPIAVQAPSTRSSDILGSSPVIQSVRDQIAQAGPSRSTVLITGETGTGKELIARELHRHTYGARSDGAPFVAVNCGAIPEHLAESELLGHERGAFTGADRRKVGFLELASGGTLFLDEVGELSASLQVKLLRALEQREFYRVGGVKPVRVSFRLVCATHRHLQQRVNEGHFRADLFYRLNVLALESPPLRQRGNDIVELFTSFLQHFCLEMGKPGPALTPAAREHLLRYGWPGNIRELRNVAERLAVLSRGSDITPEQLPREIESPSAPKAQVTLPLADHVAQVERARIVEALTQTGNAKGEAAKLLGISRPTLDKKIKLYDIVLVGSAQ